MTGHAGGVVAPAWVWLGFAQMVGSLSAFLCGGAEGASARLKGSCSTLFVFFADLFQVFNVVKLRLGNGWFIEL